MDKQTDPVCGMQIEVEDAAGQSDYEGRTYYFCSPVCKEKFDANPTRFINKSESKITTARGGGFVMFASGRCVAAR